MLKTQYTLFLSIILLDMTGVPNFTLPVIMSMVYGFSIRICIDWGNNSLTLKKTIQQLVYAIGISWLIQIIWLDFTITYNVVYFTFCTSIFSMMIISEFASWFKLGIKTYLKNLLNTIIAKDDEDKP